MQSLTRNSSVEVRWTLPRAPVSQDRAVDDACNAQPDAENPERRESLIEESEANVAACSREQRCAYLKGVLCLNGRGAKNNQGHGTARCHTAVTEAPVMQSFMNSQ